VNLLAFVGAFCMQWGIGVLIDAFTFSGWAMEAAFRASFGIVAVFQVLAWGWFVRAGKQVTTAEAVAA
jgi:hypothetical protein